MAGQMFFVDLILCHFRQKGLDHPCGLGLLAAGAQ
jgi:hypothetical protein